MKYSVSDAGVQALNLVAKQMTDAADTALRDANSLLETVDEQEKTLGPHAKQLKNALENICSHLKNAAKPIKTVAENLIDVAEAYQDIIDDDRFAGISRGSGSGSGMGFFGGAVGVGAAAAGVVAAGVVAAGIAASSGGSGTGQRIAEPNGLKADLLAAAQGGSDPEDPPKVLKLSPDELRQRDESSLENILDIWRDNLIDKGATSVAGLDATMNDLRSQYEAEMEKHIQGQQNDFFKDPDFDQLVRNINGNRPPIAGVTPGENMSFEAADSGHVNPEYGNDKGNSKNCQSCVVVFEARQRGYDAEVLPYREKSMLEKLSYDPRLAWIDPKTGKNPEYIYDVNRTTPKQYLDFICQTVKKGERYTLQFTWKGYRQGGHIVNIDRTPTGLLRIKDNQRGLGEEDEWIGDFAVLEYLSRMRYKPRRTTFGPPKPCVPELLRIDNMDFDYDVVSQIMKGNAHG